MSWFYLLIAGLFEIGWPLGYKLSDTTPHKWQWILFSFVSMVLSGLFLWLAQKTIPIGTAYAIWTGIGAIGTLLMGIFFFNDSVGMMRMISASFIIIGIVGLKIWS